MAILQANNMALIPIVYSDNWNITVNGKRSRQRQYVDYFTGVNIENGQNTITMTFEPKGKKARYVNNHDNRSTFTVWNRDKFFYKRKGTDCFTIYGIIYILGMYSVVVLAMFVIPCITAIPALIYNLLKMLNLL